MHGSRQGPVVWAFAVALNVIVPLTQATSVDGPAVATRLLQQAALGNAGQSDSPAERVAVRCDLVAVTGTPRGRRPGRPPGARRRRPGGAGRSRCGSRGGRAAPSRRGARSAPSPGRAGPGSGRPAACTRRPPSELRSGAAGG